VFSICKRICRRKEPESSSEDDSIDIVDSSDSESSESDFTANSDNEIGSNAGSDNDSNDDNDNASGGSLENNTLPVVRVNAESRLEMNSPVTTNIMLYNNTDSKRANYAKLQSFFFSPVLASNARFFNKKNITI